MFSHSYIACRSDAIKKKKKPDHHCEQPEHSRGKTENGRYERIEEAIIELAAGSKIKLGYQSIIKSIMT